MRNINPIQRAFEICATLILATELSGSIALADNVTLPVQQDTWANGNNAVAILGDKPRINVKEGGPKIGFASFNIEAAMAAGFDSATLLLPVAEASKPGRVDLHVVLAPWTESTLSFDTMPVYDSVPFASVQVTVANAGTVIDADIGGPLTNWTHLPGTNFGIALVGAEGVDVAFFSREATDGPPMEIELIGSQTTGLFTSETRQTLNMGVNGTTDIVYGCGFPDAQVVSCGFSLDRQPGVILVPFNFAPGVFTGQNCEIGFYNHGPNPAINLEVILYARCLVP